MTQLLWVLIGCWPDDAHEQEIDVSVAHVWTGVHGTACKREDYAMVRQAPPSTPRCPVCVEWALGGTS